MERYSQEKATDERPAHEKEKGNLAVLWPIQAVIPSAAPPTNEH